jgi:rhodanese-related sulfurtransferase
MKNISGFSVAAFFVLVIQAVLITSCGSQAQTKIPYEKSFLVDVRPRQEFAEGSAPGAVNIPLNEIKDRLEEFKGKEQIVVFCRSGNRSGQAKSILEENGITHVVNGGSWQDVSAVLKNGKNNGK